MKTIIKLLSLFTPRERRRLIPLTIAVLLMSILEVAGIGSIGPFMAVLADPEVIQRQPILQTAYTLGGFQTTYRFLIALGIAVFVVLFAATAFKMFVRYVIFRYVGNRRYTLGMRLFRQYIYQPYSYFLNHNTSELSKNLLAEVNQVISGVLTPAMDIFVHGFLGVAILVFLVVMNPTVALAAALVFGVIYSGLYGFVRPRLKRYGMELREANRLRFKAAGEAFGAIKDVKILGKEPAFAEGYSMATRRFTDTQIAKQVLSALPSYAMQSMTVGFGLALILVMLAIHGTAAQVLPLIAIYVYAFNRLMPNLQKVFTASSQIRYYGHTVDALHKDMTEMPPAPTIPDKKAALRPMQPYPFNANLALDGLSFSYPSSREPVLKSINLTIHKNTTVGFVGTTGCGKTTLVDVIMGLLEPTDGTVLVDRKPVGTMVPLGSWQRNFGYVPQQIYLSDDTIAANIAFGIPEHLRNDEAVEKAARVANLHDFVTTELPDGYGTIVGERGIRLSGGQRQRVGIARALYHDPDILVMDEATSALDSVTEEAVMDAIHTLMHTKTIIIIAHRITTVQECDLICLMERGRIVAQGSYVELARSNSRFRAMAKVVER
jgi:ABC-type multidrug transport system fused ATPase/permease subunit